MACPKREASSLNSVKIFLKRYIEASRSDSDLLVRWWSLVLLPYDLIILLFGGLDKY